MAIRWLARLHAFGLNAALFAGLALMPAVVLTGYWSGHGPAGAGARMAFDGLRGTIDGAADTPRRRTRGAAF